MRLDDLTEQPFSRHELQLIAHAQRAPGSLPGFLVAFSLLSVSAAVLIVGYVILYRYMRSFSDDAVYIRRGAEFVPMVPHFIPAFSSLVLLTIVSFLFTTFLAWLLWRYQITLHKLCFRFGIIPEKVA
ncbi:MAG: hypothetical protein M3463_05885 [Verrucomicrobiota bacterium]|nr:hypothetical protein [Verrucomicrobiota bacterium]